MLFRPVAFSRPCCFFVVWILLASVLTSPALAGGLAIVGTYETVSMRVRVENTTDFDLHQVALRLSTAWAMSATAVRSVTPVTSISTWFCARATTAG